MDLGFRNKAVLDLPMRMEDHDPTNLRTLDRSPTGAHATFGDGATPAFYPTKLDYHRGYDAGDSPLVDEKHFSGSAVGVFNTAETSIVVTFKPNYNYLDPYSRYLFDTSNNSRYFIVKGSTALTHVLRIALGDTSIASVPRTTYGPYWRTNQWNQIVVSGTTGNTSAWLNGQQVLANDNTAWSPDNPANYYVGIWHGASGDAHTGEWYGCQVYPFMLSGIQVQDLYLNMMKKVNRV